MGGHRAVEIRALASFALAAAVALSACKGGDGRLAYIDRLSVNEADLQGHPWLGLGPDGLQFRAVQALQEKGRVGSVEPGARAPDGSAPWRARVDLSYVRTLPIPGRDPAGAEPEVRAEIALEISLLRDGDSPGAGERVIGAGRGHVDFRLGDPEVRADAFLSALDAALLEASSQVGAHLETAGMTEEQLLSELRSGDAARRDLAARVLAERKSPAALPVLIEKLGEPDRTLQLRAIGALVAIGDERAVPPLIEATMGRDPSFVAQVAYALGEIGGTEAEGFLFTASTGHPEELVRRAAQEALSALRGARARAATTRTAR